MASTARNQHQQTIRQSCNSCAQQKVRCSKERPNCTRCASKGLECEYAYSRRTGRRSAASLSSRNSISGPIAGLPPSLLEAASIASNSMLEDPSGFFSDCGFGEGSLDGLDISSATVASALMPFDFSWTSPPPPPLTMSNGSTASDSRSSSSDKISPTMSPAVAAGLQAGIPYQSHHDMHRLSIDPGAPFGLDDGMVPEYWSNSWQPMQPGLNSIVGSTLGSPTDLQFFMPDIAAVSKQPRGSISLAQTPTTQPPRSTSISMPTSNSDLKNDHQTGPNSCMAQALELIASLHIPTETPCLSSPTAASNSDNDNNPTIDQILFTNRAAIASLQRILNCITCLGHEDRGVSLACFLIAGKIVSWYATALSISTSGSATNDTSKSCASNMSGPTSMTPVPNSAANATPIFLGDYLLDASTSRSVCAGLVLAELAEYMQPLLTRFVERLPGIPNVLGAAGGDVASGDDIAAAKVPAMGTDGGGKGCYELNCALRERVRGIVDEARRVTLSG